VCAPRERDPERAPGGERRVGEAYEGKLRILVCKGRDR
jgi:hypothetical protein